MRVSFWSVLKGVLVIVALAGLAAVSYGTYSRLPGFLREMGTSSPAQTVAPGEEVIVTIPKGASLSQVGTILQEKGVISNRFLFKIVALIRGEQRNVKAGDYALRTGGDAGEVLDLLISGKTLMFSVTIPEGYNIFQIADLFQQNSIMSRKEFLDLVNDPALVKDLGVEGSSLEGYLFPDTYHFRPSELGNRKQLIRRMVQRFLEVYDKYARSTAEANGWTMLQVVTMASLIEKEARADEHALVSAVFHNRLELNMRLQSDPTVIYKIKPMGAKITRADLDRKQPYNTYQVSGLPPGPIANPGKASIIAAVQPANVNYLYFVAKNDGSHQFSSNLKDHNRWVNLYQRQPRTQTP